MTIPVAAAMSNLGQQGVGLMVGAAAALYVAGRSAADAVAGGGRPASAGRLAVGHWMPMVTVAAVAAAMGQVAVAVGLVTATAVACLSLGVGTLGLVAAAPVAPPAAGRRTWPLLLPVGLLPLLAGFHRDLRWTDAAVLLIEGACVLAVWADRSQPAEPAETGPAVASRSAVLRPVQLALAVGLSVVGGAMAVLALTRAAAAREAATPGLLTATVLAPLVVLPMLGSIADWANRGPALAGRAASSLVGVAFLNVCVGLPVVAATAAGRAWVLDTFADSRDPTPVVVPEWAHWLSVNAAPLGLPTTLPTTGPATAPVGPAVSAHAVAWQVPLPLTVWRVDLVAFVVLAAALLPIGLGRYTLTRGQGAGLVVAYAIYLYLSLKVGVGVQ